MKKLFFLILLISAICSNPLKTVAQCSATCTAPTQTGGGVTPIFNNDSAGAPFVTDWAHFQWADLNNSNYCFAWHNPAIRTYHVIILQDGLPFKDEKNWYCYKLYDACQKYSLGSACFAYWFQITPGHTYDCSVAAVCTDGSENISPIYTFDTKPTPSQATGILKTGGKKGKK